MEVKSGTFPHCGECHIQAHTSQREDTRELWGHLVPNNGVGDPFRQECRQESCKLINYPKLTNQLALKGQSSPGYKQELKLQLAFQAFLCLCNFRLSPCSVVPECGTNHGEKKLTQETNRHSGKTTDTLNFTKNRDSMKFM